MANAHAFLAPSGAPIWGPGGCPYYPTIAAMYPQQEDSPEAMEGTAAHYLLEARLNGEVVELDSLAPNGHPTTQEMFDCTDAFVDWVERVRAIASAGTISEASEVRVHMPQIHPTLNWGTADWSLCDYTSRTIYGADYKHGHRFVDVWENWQLVNYVQGLANHFGVTIDDTWNFVLVIAQPRSFHPDGTLKRWECSGARMLELIGKLRDAATEAAGPNPRMNTGDHCRDCEGRTSCPAFRRSGENGIDLSLRGTPEEMDNGAKGTFRTMVAAAIKRLEGMATGLDADIQAAVRGGAYVPGWEVRPKDTRLTWQVPVTEIYALGEAMGVPLLKTETYGDVTIAYDAATPTQAINLGIDAAVIMEYAKRPLGGLKVVPSETTAAAKAFK